MSKNKQVNVTVAQAQAIINEAKETVRSMEWVPKKTVSNPQWLEFVSACRVRSQIREDVMFVAQYRDAKTISDGSATIQMAEQFNAAILVGPCRIIALDTSDLPHKNKVGFGRPLYKQTITSRTHLHTWSDEGYGYAEPVNPALNDIESLVRAFLTHANLTLVDDFKHPLKGQQIGLPL